MCNKLILKIFLLLVVVVIQAQSKHQQKFGYRRNRNSGKYGAADLDSPEIDENPDNTVQIVDDEDTVTASSSRIRTTIAPTSNGYPPKFTKPNDLNRFYLKPSGNTLKLKCTAEGDPKPTIEWTKDGKTIDRKMGQVQYSKWSITLEDLIPVDSGSYTCKVRNIHGSINFTSKLEVSDRVNHKPIFEKSPKNVTAIVGTNVTFEIQVLSDFHSSRSWFVQKCLNDSNCVKTKIERDEDNAGKLQLFNVTHADEGWYTCVAASSLGSTSESAYLRVVDSLPDELSVRKERAKNNEWYGYLMTFLMIFFVVALGIILFVWKKYTKTKKLQRQMERVNQWTKKVIVVQPCIDNGNPGLSETLQMPIVRIEKHRSAMAGNSNDPNMISEYEFPIDLNWEFPRAQLELGKNLGEGAFGKVVMAHANGLVKTGQTTIVAVKMLKEGHTDEDVKDLVCEMEVMKMIGTHINIINLLGCCCQDGPLFVIVEYAPHGNLRDFLRKHRPNSYADNAQEKEKQTLTQKDLVSFAYQIARGMEYLASRKCIHRDLAARNVLVSDDFVMKIADFGLARDIHTQDYYRKTTDGRLPVKWMAPESLFDKVYDTQSDVWSYGILLWEIMTLGGTPYPSIPSVKNLFELLKKGERMEKPALCSIDIYMLMRETWHWHPMERPSFSEIVEDLDKILSITANEEYLDLGLPQLETPPSSSDESGDNKDEFPYLL
ncbi:CLUMA_CG020474, isoform B [Clunio marinus]|uniref:Fibroblast growth factor receptor n=1 Tax=Clunio marinus TaxID=568069 RepID=A0A1J1J525_9DIPT|nr:CLUMA_CG020474, isoform B [Clunio marinus]